VLKDPTMRQRLDVMGAEPGGQAPAQLDTLIADEIVKWNDVVTTANIQAQ
jgi:tripartite-type tricarboxylate transporter receptor subunit TctC